MHGCAFGSVVGVEVQRDGAAGVVPGSGDMGEGMEEKTVERSEAEVEDESEDNWFVRPDKEEGKDGRQEGHGGGLKRGMKDELNIPVLGI